MSDTIAKMQPGATADEVYRLMRDEEDPEERFALAAGLYWYCADYHWGQGCPLYAMMDRIGFKPGACDTGPTDEGARHVYNVLAGLKGEGE